MSASSTSDPDIYIVRIEIEVLPASERYETSEMYKGKDRMFCSGPCLCWAGSEQEAISMVQESLTQNAMKLIRVGSVEHYVEANCCTVEIVEWANLAYETEEVVYGIFLCHYE